MKSKLECRVIESVTLAPLEGLDAALDRLALTVNNEAPRGTVVIAAFEWTERDE